MSGQLDAASYACHACGSTGIYIGLLLGLALFVPLTAAIYLPKERTTMKTILVIIAAVAALLAGTASKAATVTLSSGASCSYSAVAVNAAGNLAVTCAAVVTPVIPGGGPPAPPPVVVAPAPAPVVDDPCAALPPSTRAYCHSPTPALPGPVVGAPAPPAPSAPAAGVLSINGVYVRHTTGHAIYPLPGILAGQEVSISVSAGWGLVLLTVREPGGAPVRSKWTGLPIDHLRLEGGYGDQTFRALVGGDYTVEVEGGGSMTTVNSWRF